MDWKAKLIELLGLDGTADDDAIEAALSAKMTATAPQSAVITGAAPAAVTDDLDATDRQVIALMGINEDEYRASLKARGQKKEAI